MNSSGSSNSNTESKGLNYGSSLKYVRHAISGSLVAEGRALMSKHEFCPVCHKKLRYKSMVECPGCKEYVCLNVETCFNAGSFKCFDCLRKREPGEPIHNLKKIRMMSKHTICHECKRELPYERIECVECGKCVHTNAESCFNFSCCKCWTCWTKKFLQNQKSSRATQRLSQETPKRFSQEDFQRLSRGVPDDDRFDPEIHGSYLRWVAGRLDRVFGDPPPPTPLPPVGPDKKT